MKKQHVVGAMCFAVWIRVRSRMSGNMYVDALRRESKMRIHATIVALVTAVLLLTSCDDTFGPIFSMSVEIRGPESLVGTWTEAPLWEDVPSGYRCEPRLTLRAKGGSSSSWRTVIWNSLVIRHYDADGNELDEPQVFTGQTLDWMLGSLSPGRQILTNRIPVVGTELPFRWELELRYYDPHTGRNDLARFSSRCISP